ncbi:F-box domain-containing protein [Coprinopsis cinerea AmutBmut pab1-1]|nr:F-box domain-containing protein [Coprinopsis cinerea AmutBmut pab1-1]
MTVRVPGLQDVSATTRGTDPCPSTRFDESLGLPEDIVKAARSDSSDPDEVVLIKAVTLVDEYREQLSQLNERLQRQRIADAPHPSVLDAKGKEIQAHRYKLRAVNKALSNWPAHMAQMPVHIRSELPEEVLQEASQIDSKLKRTTLAELFNGYGRKQQDLYEHQHLLQHPKPTDAQRDIEADIEMYTIRMRVCQSISSKWRRLPPEIWAYIFELFAFSKPGPPTKFPGAVFAYPALLLCAVCRLWRAIGMSTPALWKLIKIAATIEGGLAGEQAFIHRGSLQVALAALSRMQTCPWTHDIKIQSRRELGSKAPPTQIDRRNTLATFLQHPSIAYLQRVRFQTTPFMDDVGSITLPFAEHVTLWRHTDEGEHGTDGDGRSVKPLPNIPRATKVIVHSGSPCYPRTINLAGAPWTNLTHLAISPLYHRLCQTILKLAPSVKRCYFYLQKNSDVLAIQGLPAAPSRSVQSALTDLTCLNENLFSTDISRKLQFPALTTLRVAIQGYNRDEFRWSPGSALALGSLKRLYISGMGPFYLESHIIPALRMCPQLSELMLLVKLDYKALFKWLTFDALQPRLQRLQYLTLYCVVEGTTPALSDLPPRFFNTKKKPVPGRQFPIDCLADMIRSRVVVGEASTAEHASSSGLFRPRRLKHVRVWFEESKFTGVYMKLLRQRLETRIFGAKLLRVPHIEKDRFWDEGFMGCFDKPNRAFITSD